MSELMGERPRRHGAIGKALGLTDEDFAMPNPRWITAIAGAITTIGVLLAALVWDLREIRDLDPSAVAGSGAHSDALRAAAQRALETGTTTLLYGAAAVAVLTVVLTGRGSRWGAAWVIGCGLAFYGLAWLVTYEDVKYVQSKQV